MKFQLSLCLWMFTFVDVYAQPDGLHAIQDEAYDQVMAGRRVPEVRGKLLHLSSEALRKTIIDYSVVTLTGQERKTTRPAPDGSFRLELEPAFPYQQIWFAVDEVFYAGLYVNEGLFVELDIAKIKATGRELNWNGAGVRYLGKDGPLNVYMNDYVKFRRQDQLTLSGRLSRLARPLKPVAAEVLAALGSVYDSLKLIQDAYIATHPSPYGWLLENERLSEFYGEICVRYWNSPMEADLFEKIRQHKTYLVSNSSTLFMRYLSNYFVMHPSNRIIVPLQVLAALPDLSAHERAAIDTLLVDPQPVSVSDPALTLKRQRCFQVLQPRMQALQQEMKLARNIHFIDSLFAPSGADVLKLLLNDSKDIDEQRAALEQLLPVMRTNWCRQFAQTRYTQTLATIASVNKALAGAGTGTATAGFGQPLLQTDFGASLYKVSGMTADDFLANLQRSFAGKAIVFDLWATWCMPCLSEMPHSKKLQLEGKDLPVVFVYVCTANGSDEDKWKRKVAELEQPGIHFFIDRALDAELARFFSFNGYPGYAFIDRRGVYRPGALKRVSTIANRAELAALVE